MTGTGKWNVICLIQLPFGCFSGNRSILSTKARMNSFCSASVALPYVTEFNGNAANVISNGYTLYVNGVALAGTN